MGPLEFCENLSRHHFGDRTTTEKIYIVIFGDQTIISGF